MEPLRYHIIIDVFNLAETILDDEVGLEKFLKELPGEIGMKILHGPTVVKGIPENPGITGFVIIDFSHISAHTFTKYKKVLVDIFSCKEYSQDTALAFVLTYFHADKSQAKIKVVSWG